MDWHQIHEWLGGHVQFGNVASWVGSLGILIAGLSYRQNIRRHRIDDRLRIHVEAAKINISASRLRSVEEKSNTKITGLVTVLNGSTERLTELRGWVTGAIVFFDEESDRMARLLDRAEIVWPPEIRSGRDFPGVVTFLVPEIDLPKHEVFVTCYAEFVLDGMRFIVTSEGSVMPGMTKR